MSTTRPDAIIAALALALLVLPLAGMSNAVVPLVARDLALPSETIAIVMGARFLLVVALLPFGGMLSDRYGTAPVIAFGGLAGAAGTALIAISPTTLGFAGGFAVLGALGLATLSAAVVLAVCARHVPTPYRALAFGGVVALEALGRYGGPALAFNFMEAEGWRPVLVGVACAHLVALPLALMARTRGVDPGRPAPYVDDVVGQAFGDPTYWAVAAIMVVIGIVSGAIDTNTPAFAIHLGFSVEVMGSATFKMGVAGAVSAVVLGGLVATFVGPRPVLVVAMLGQAVTTLALAVVPLTVASRFENLLLVSGVFSTVAVPVLFAVVADRFGTRYIAALLAFLIVPSEVGANFASTASYLFRDRYGYEALFLVLAALPVIGAAIAMAVRDTPAPPLRPAVQPARDGRLG